MNEIELLREYVRKGHIRQSVPREHIVRIFLETERHLSIQELHGLVQKKFPQIGIATIYRTMKIACDAGLAREIDFGEGNMRYEHHCGHEHHDHLVCIKCGTFEEIKNSRIEQEQEVVAKEYGYILVRHRHMLYGICPKCGRK